MPASADVISHLDRNHAAVRQTFLTWSGCSPDQDRTELMEQYFEQANLGETTRIGSASVLTERNRAADDAPTVLLVGSHDISELTPSGSGTSPTVGNEIRGPGAGSLLGSTVAFLEGFKAVVMAGSEPVNLRAISVGAGDSTLGLIEEHGGVDTDVVFLTNAIAWAPELPTITLGSRGRIEVQVTLIANRQINDRAYAGATLNPLNRLVDVLASLRDERGRIALPGFYNRAERPEANPDSPLDDEWLGAIGAARAGGSLSGLERATQWPVISVLDVQGNASSGSSPARASARLAIYLVPRQRPVDVERTLRAWMEDQLPDQLNASIRIEESARPYLGSIDQAPVAAQARALKRVHGRAPIVVPAGGTIGAGEIHYLLAAPVLFAGISGPHQRWGTAQETLMQSQFDDGVAVAAETCLQLPRRTTLRST